MCCYAQALLLQGHVGASVTLDQVCEMCTFHYFTRRGKEMYISRSVEGPVPAESSGPLPVLAMRRRLPRPIQNTKADPFAVSSRDQTTAPQQTWNAQFSVSVYSPGRACRAAGRARRAAGSCQARPYLPGARVNNFGEISENFSFLLVTGIRNFGIFRF